MHARYAQAMNTLKLILFFLLIAFFSCSDNKKQHLLSKSQHDTTSVSKTETKFTDVEIKANWGKLCKIGGCLTGGQYANNGKFGGEGCVLTNDSEWIIFFSINERDLAAFLIKQIPDRTKTIIHTCPFQNATKGELAIYCLHNIYKTNFYELSDDYKKLEANIVNKFGNEQNWIWHIQKSKEQVWELQRRWWIKYKEN